jgi:putative oxidoreductase
MAGEIVLGLALIMGIMTRWAALASLPIMIGAIIPHAGNGFSFSNPGGGWEFPVFWSILLVAQAMLGGGAYALGNPVKQEG